MTIALAALYSQMSLASCTEAYARKVLELSGKLNPLRNTAIVNLGGEVVVVGTLAAVGALSVAGALILPATALASGAYLGALSHKKNSFAKAYMSLRQAEAGKGAAFELLVQKATQRNSLASEADVQHAVLRLNAENAFCEEDELNGKIRLLNFNKMAKLVSSEL